jgi:hypothetical protein
VRSTASGNDWGRERRGDDRIRQVFRPAYGDHGPMLSASLSGGVGNRFLGADNSCSLVYPGVDGDDHGRLTGKGNDGETRRSSSESLAR